MILKNIKDNQKARGFTIVELLVVIVVIGILAAITIVSYTGITSKAKGSQAQANVNNIVAKVEVYNADGPTNIYPLTLAALTGAASTTTYFLSGVTFDATTLSTSNLPASPSEVNFVRCGTSGTSTAPASLAAITVTSGIEVGYWNYSTPAINYATTGITATSASSSYLGVTSPAINYNSFPIACYATAS